MSGCGRGPRHDGLSGGVAGPAGGGRGGNGRTLDGCLRPALFDPLSESSGSAEPEAVGRQARSPAAQRAENGLEGPPPVQAEAQGSLEAQEDVGASPASAPQEAWAAASSHAPPVATPAEALTLARQSARHFSDAQPDVLAEAAVEGGERPALLEQAEQLNRAVVRARRGDATVRAPWAEEGRTALSGRTGQRSGGWLERGEDSAAAVDRAFQRDSRRYDQGFALYRGGSCGASDTDAL